MFGGQVAGAGARSRPAAPSTTGHVHSLHAYFLRPGDPAHPDHLRRRPHPRRPQLHDPARRRDPARPRDLQPLGVVPRARARPRAPVRDARRARSRRRCRRSASGSSRTPTASRRASSTGSAASARSTRARRELPRWLDPDAERPRARAARVVPRQRQAARRPAAARVHRRVRVRPHAARHRGDGARPLVGRRPLHDREPRPRDVVPPAVAGRRVAAVPPEEPVGAGRARPRRGLHLPPRRRARGHGDARRAHPAR